MLTKVPEEGIECIVSVFIACLKLGFPMEWKRARVIMIPKPGKDKSLPKSYRPISLLPVLGKLLERVLASRISKHLEERKYLNPNQSGFRKGRSTNDQRFRLAQSVGNCMTMGKDTLGHFLDVKKAFDSVWSVWWSARRSEV